MSVTPGAPCAAELIRRLDEAICDDVEECCHNVKHALESLISLDQSFLDESYLQPDPQRYARRLMHRDPAGRYSVLAMVWGRGQGTPLHDHAGMWCVECVYRGVIRVKSYSLLTDPEAEIIRFRHESTILAGVGQAGALIPPFEYHSIENADDSPSVTLHVYGGDMTWCNAFVPVGDGFRRERRLLSCTA